MPQARPDNLPFHEMAAALQAQPDIRQARPAPLPDVDSEVPTVPQQFSDRAVYGGAGGTWKKIIDLLAGFSVKTPNFQMSFPNRPSELDKANDALKTSATTMAKRRWEKAAEALEKAKKTAERARPATSGAARDRTQTMDRILPDWAMRALGDEAPDSNRVPAGDYASLISRARARKDVASKEPKQPARMKPHPGLLQAWKDADQYDRDRGTNTAAQPARNLIDDMLKRARTKEDLSELAGWIYATGMDGEYEQRFDELEAKILAAP